MLLVVLVLSEIEATDKDGAEAVPWVSTYLAVVLVRITVYSKVAGAPENLSAIAWS